jgi:aminopeptidase N
MIWRLTAFLLLCTVSLGADTYPRQPGVDILHYVFRIGLTDQSSEISGETTVTAKFLRDSVAELNLDLTSMNVATGMTVQSVRRGGPIDIPGPPSDNIVFTHLSNRLHLVLPPASKAGQEFVFTVRYRGTAPEGLRIGPNMHGDRSFFGENWPNLVRNWLPMVDHPYDKATGEFVVTAPNSIRSSPTAC